MSAFLRRTMGVFAHVSLVPRTFNQILSKEYSQDTDYTKQLKLKFLSCPIAALPENFLMSPCYLYRFCSITAIFQIIRELQVKIYVSYS